MTYALLCVPFLTVTAVLTVCSMRVPGARRRLLAATVAAAVLLALTAVFDSVMIAAGLFTYPEAHLIGVRVGLAPVEDFTYALCAAYLVPALDALLSARRRHP